MGNSKEKYKKLLEKFKELLEKYKRFLRVDRGNNEVTIKDSVRSILRFLAWLDENNYNIEELNQEIVNEYISYCYGKYAVNSLIPTTINLRKFCCYFLGKNVIIKLPVAKSPNRDKQALTKTEVKAMFEVVKGKPLETAVLKVLYYTGMRASEVIGLDIEDIDFARLQIIVKRGKGSVFRIVNITEDCAVAIQRWLEIKPKVEEDCKNALFISPHGKRLNHTYLWNLVKRTAAMAGIEKNVYPHKFRITMITLMSEEGLSPREIQIQSGHRDISTLLGYIQHTPSRIRKSYERVFNDVKTKSIILEGKKLSVEKNTDYYKKLAFEISSW